MEDPFHIETLGPAGTGVEDAAEFRMIEKEQHDLHDIADVDEIPSLLAVIIAVRALEKPNLTGLQVTHRFTVSEDRQQLRVVTTVSSSRARVPFTLSRFYRKFERLPPFNVPPN